MSNMATKTIFNHGDRPLKVTICGTHHAIPAQAGMEFEAKLADEIIARAKADGVPFKFEPLPGALSADVRQVIAAVAEGRLVPVKLFVDDFPQCRRETLLRVAECVGLPVHLYTELTTKAQVIADIKERLAAFEKNDLTGTETASPAVKEGVTEQSAPVTTKEG
jgi:hypothetical protein